MFGISRSLFLGAWLIGSGALAVAAPCTAQVPQPNTYGMPRLDSAAMARPDSAVPKRDSVPALRPDSAAPPPDSLKKAPGGEATAPSPPADSMLTGACSSPDASSAVAPDVLLVVFLPSVDAAERSAVARAVHGKLSPAGGEGAYYLRVPSADSDDRLRAIADQVILLPGVQQVGAKACPHS